MIVAGTIPHKLVPTIKTLYDQMPAPEMGHCHGQLRHLRGPFFL